MKILKSIMIVVVCSAAIPGLAFLIERKMPEKIVLQPVAVEYKKEFKLEDSTSRQITVLKKIPHLTFRDSTRVLASIKGTYEWKKNK